jgi:3-hydroxymyristoyl/3-hydroxydecanoyl-(acyl carrier protein) dehydratase
MSFLFVDQITAIDSDRASGRLRRAGGAALPPWLIVEAVGQLAAWIAMRRSDFTRRPVAALVGDIRLSGEEARGDIELEARIERLDARAILYAGAARCAGGEIAALARCVGPLLPMELFDDPAVVRARFEALHSGSAAAAGALAGDVLHPDLSPIELGAESVSSQLQVPASAPFFADHFPRRPVYPASLLAAALSQIAAPLAAQLLDVAPGGARTAGLSDYKVRSFSLPGQRLELTGELRSAREDAVGIRVCASAEGKRVASGVLEYRVAPRRTP